LLGVISTDLLLMKEWLEDGVKIIESTAGVGKDLVDFFDDLYVEIDSLSDLCERWREKKTKEPRRRKAKFRPSPARKGFVIAPLRIVGDVIEFGGVPVGTITLEPQSAVRERLIETFDAIDQDAETIMALEDRLVRLRSRLRVR
jgi:hypothetical protein